MALLRITPATAVPTVRQLGGDLSRWLKEAGRLAAAESIVNSLQAVEAYTADKTLDIELAVSTPLAAEDAVTVAGWVGGGCEPAWLSGGTPDSHAVAKVPGGRTWALRVHVRALSQPPAQRAGSPRSGVLVVVSSGALDDQQRAALERATEDRPLALVVASPDVAPAIRAIVQPQAWCTETCVLSGLPAGGLAERLGTPPWSTTAELLHAYAVAGALDALTSVFSQAIEQELRTLKVKRAMTQQRASAVQQRPGTAGTTEGIGDVRARLQRQLGDFERGAGERLGLLVAVPGGSLWTTLESRLLELSDLEREARNKSISLRVPKTFEDELLNLVRTEVGTHCLADLRALTDLFRVVAADLEQAVARDDGPSLQPQFRYLTDEKLGRLLDATVSPGRGYRGELPRPGFFEYVMIARRYQMILFMFISAFGLSFLRQYPEVMIPAAVVLLSLGGINVYNTTRRERVESVDKELEKAREAYRADFKRILPELQRGWSAILSQHLADEQASVLAQVEAALREHQARRQSQATTEKDTVQRQIQGHESAERRLMAPSKGKDAVAGALAQVRGELRQLVMAAAAAKPMPPTPVAGR